MIKFNREKMCRHIVMVLPFCASCDCIEALINNNKEKFKNLCDYEIINISGVDQTNIYRTVKDVKNKIKECEKNDKKTLTLTVNRMLTGSTIEQWDTMIYLKDTASPQEYDQSIFRLQNQYVTEYLNLDTGDMIKYNKKPQTILVDFDPNRMFLMQETKSLIYNANIDKSGNSKLEERIRKELKISPIITLNKNKIHEVQPIDIMEAVSNYSKNRGVFEEVCELPVDLSLIEYPEILNVIEKQAKLGSKQGLKIYDDGLQDEFDFGDYTVGPIDDDPGDGSGEKTETTDDFGDDSVENIKNNLASRFRTYYARILFFAMLSKSNVSSLENIINVIDIGENQRIAQNLGLEKNILFLINKNMHSFTLRQLD